MVLFLELVCCFTLGFAVVAHVEIIAIGARVVVARDGGASIGAGVGVWNHV